MDHGLRELDRRARASGSADDEARVLAHRLRAGDIKRNSLMVCVAAGMASANLAVDVSQEDAAHECARFLPPPSNPLFEPILEQVKVVWDLNQRLGWGLTVADFASLALPTNWPNPGGPARPAGGHNLATWTLVRYTHTVGTTFEDQVRAIQSRHRNVSRWDQLRSDEANLRLLDGIPHPGTGLSLEAIDLGANWNGQTGMAPRDVRNAQSPHAGILASVAIHTKWVAAMDGSTVPFVWAPGYQCQFNGRWSAVPWCDLARLERRVQLDRHHDGYHHQDYAVPAPAGVA